MGDTNGGFTVSYPGQSFSFQFSNSSNLDFIAGLVQGGGLANYETPTPGVLIALAQEQSGVVLDVGANTGLFTLMLAAANPRIAVCAFEPLATVRALLTENIALNPALAERISVKPFGLSKTAGSFTFYEHINDYGLIPTSSSLELSHVQGNGTFREHTIETQTLDSWSETLGPVPVHLMKVDVEGHEHAVVDGGRRFLSKHRPYLTLEVLGTAETASINQLMLEGNYLDIAMAPGVLRQCAEVRYHSDAWNHLLCPAEKAEMLFSLCRRLDLRLEFA